MRITSVEGNIGSSVSGGTGPAPSIYAANVGSTYVSMMMIPASGTTPTGYNVYRADVGVAPGQQINGATAITTDPTKNSPWFEDGVPAPHGTQTSSVPPSNPPLVAGQTYTYTATQITAAGESTQSAPWVVTTLSGAIQLPQPPAEPGTGHGDGWIAPPPTSYVPAPGGKVWLSAGNVPLNNAADIQAAMSGYTPGDIIVIQAGQTYRPASGGFTLAAPANPSNLWTYIISSEDPVYKSGGTLPAYSYSTAFAGGANTATGVGGNWVTRAGRGTYLAGLSYTMNFSAVSCVTMGTGASGNQPSYVRFIGIDFAPQMGGCTFMGYTLSGVLTVTSVIAGTLQLQQYIVASTTPTNTGGQWIRSFGTGTGGVGTYNLNSTPANWNYGTSGAPVQFQAACWAGNLVLFQSTSGNADGSYNTVPSANHIYFDRCYFGNDPSTIEQNGSPFAYVRRGIFAACDHLLVHQCQLEGFLDGGAPSNNTSRNGFIAAATDGQTVLTVQGQYQCFQNNYVDSGCEGFLCGGVFIPPLPQFPQDHVCRYNYVQHNPNVMGTNYAQQFKNHWEFKAMIRAQVYGCCMNYGYNANAAGGIQQGHSMLCTPRSQPPAGVPATLYSKVTDIDIHDNMILNGGGALSIACDNLNITVTAYRIRFANNVIHVNPIVNTRNAAQTTQPFCFLMGSQCPDITVDHNTFVINLNSANIVGAGNPQGLNATAQDINTTYGWMGTASQPSQWYMPCDRIQVTNNIWDGTWLIGGSGIGGATPASKLPKVIGTGSVFNNNMSLNDTGNYNVNTQSTGNVSSTYTNAGFNNFVNSATAPTQPSDWALAPSSLYYASGTNGTPMGVVVSSGALAIATTSLANAVVGTDYSTLQTALVATGGSGVYAWSVDSATPNKHLWFNISRSGQPYGTPQYTPLSQQNISDTVVLRCTDAATPTSSVTASFTITTTVSGTLTIRTPTTLPAATQNGGYCYQLLASGGLPPYLHWSKVSSTGTNTWNVTPSGWLEGVPTATASPGDTVTIGLRDAVGNIASNVTVTIPVNSTIQLAGIDFNVQYPGSASAGVVRVPFARVGHKYSHQLHPANGGTGSAQTYSVAAGSLPSGLSMNATGLITGTPSATGNSNCQIKVTDGGGNTTNSYPLILNVGPQNKGTKPALNSATGVFFVDTQGYLCDPNGFRFLPVGLNHLHYDQTFSGYATSGVNSVRYVMYFTQFRGSNPAGSQPITTYINNAVSQHTNIGEFVIFTNFNLAGTTTNITGDTTPANMGTTAAWWCDNVATFNASALHGKCGINISNEWGPGNINLQYCYAAAWSGGVGTGTYQLPVQSVNTSTRVITLAASVNDATHPLANAAQIGYVYFGGGNINKAIAITGVAGTSGAYTVTATNAADVSGWTSGGTLSGGAIGMMRAAGYTDPFYVDAGASFGQNVSTYIPYGPTIAKSDPLANTVLSYHAYNGTSNYCAYISTISRANPGLIQLNDTETFHPMVPQLAGGGYSGVAPFTNTYSAITAYFVSGVNGMTQINGAIAAPQNITGGPQPTPFNIQTSVNTSGYSAYTSGGFIVPDTPSNTYWHIDRLTTVMASLRSSGVGVLVGEYGPQTGTGPTPTLMDVIDVALGAVAYDIGDVYWALDDSQPFGAVANGSGTYTVPTQLSAAGIDVILNPRYGLHCRASGIPFLLP